MVAVTNPHSFYRLAVIASLVVHGTVIFSSAGWNSLKPQFGVTQAPASVEVQLVEENPLPVPPPEEEVLTARAKTEEPAAVIQKEEKPKLEEMKPAPVVPQQGAVRRDPESYLDNPAPVYPERARLRGWEGVVLLAVTVDAKGYPTQVDLEKSSGHSILDESALKAVQKWRFKPASIGQMTFSGTVRIPIRFKLTEA
jgi:TonB family protein